jgi:hypothetical protein
LTDVVGAAPPDPAPVPEPLPGLLDVELEQAPSAKERAASPVTTNEGFKYMASILLVMGKTAKEGPVASILWPSRSGRKENRMGTEFAP